MNTWTWFSIFYFFAAVTISQLFIDEKLRLVFLMIMFLLYVSLYNVYFSFKYYIKIRNEPGVKGDRGDPGGSGQDGTDGVCAMAKGCGIAHCRRLIVDELQKIFPEYIKIREKLRNNKALNPKEKKQNRQINRYIDILIPKCENYESSSDNPDTDVFTFKKIIRKTLNKSSTSSNKSSDSSTEIEHSHEHLHS